MGACASQPPSRPRPRTVAEYDAVCAAMKAALEGGDSDRAGFFLVPWKCDAANEQAIKEDCKATIRCYPLEGQEEAAAKACFYSGEPATHMAIFARAF